MRPIEFNIKSLFGSWPKLSLFLNIITNVSCHLSFEDKLNLSTAVPSILDLESQSKTVLSDSDPNTHERERLCGHTE